MSTRPDLSNYAEAATKILTPRAWLSSWSGPSSRASVLDNLPKLTLPTLVLGYAGDNAIHPMNSPIIYEHSPAADKQKAQVEGDHFGFGLTPGQDGRREAVASILEWLQHRFPR